MLQTGANDYRGGKRARCNGDSVLGIGGQILLWVSIKTDEIKETKQGGTEVRKKYLERKEMIK